MNPPTRQGRKLGYRSLHLPESEGLNVDTAGNYRGALAEEISRFDSCLDVHDLPEIFHYWSNRHVRPKLLPFGFDSAHALFVKVLANRCRAMGDRPARFVSLGSGNCELEIRLAGELCAQGHSRFLIDCIDLNSAMLARARVAAQQAGVARHLKFTECDLNSGIPAIECDAAIANQSLHHLLNLEGMFGQIKGSLTAGGTFVISDMIGRNGHQRWPEALHIVHEFWRKLPPSYRFNRASARYEELFADWDCSVVGFEGIRSQDILPLLLREFHFELFIPFGNVIDPFVDRSFGYHFDAAAEWDRAFIDDVQRRDDAEINSGALTPTHMLAVVGNDSRTPRTFPGHLSPESCVRVPDKLRQMPSAEDGRAPSYHWLSWPHSSERELEIACCRLVQCAHRLSEQSDRVADLESEVEQRTLWARTIENEVSARTGWARTLESEMEKRTIWARDLERDLAERTAWAHALEAEAAEMKAWAHRLADELNARTRDLAHLENELQQYLHRPHRFVARLFRGAYRRLSRLLHAPVRKPSADETLSEPGTRKQDA